MTAAGKLHILPYEIDLQQHVCEFIETQYRDSLPDLSHLHILIPSPNIAGTLRRQLISQFSRASSHKNTVSFIGAGISTLRQWINNHISLTDSTLTQITNHSRLLLILEAIKQHPDLFHESNNWQVATALAQLFDELTQYNIDPLQFEHQHWQQHLQQCYGKNNSDARDFNHLTHEARLIYQLWQAWQQQMKDESLVDDTTAYQLKLHATSSIEPHTHFILAGVETLSPNEMDWLKRYASKQQVNVFLQADTNNWESSSSPDHHIYRFAQQLDFNVLSTPTQSELSRLINNAYNITTEPLLSRITHCKNQLPQLKHEQIKLYAGNSEEKQAQAIELQVRQWLLAGKKSIGIVTENRKLARRVRALLERASVNLVDAVGWSLATTSAASILERWLEVLENDFAYQSFLDLLKSPYHQLHDDRDFLLQVVYRFERDIVLHENINNDIRRYLNNLRYRKNRLHHWTSDTYDAIENLLERISDIAAPFSSLITEDNTSNISHYLNTLITSLDALGILKRFEEDEAGKSILDEFNFMQASLQTSDPVVSWQDFRIWLSSSLEQHHFSPTMPSSSVRLLNLQQSNANQFDGLIIASCEANSLPGPMPKTAFFNHSVRSSLGLPDWKSDKARKFYYFRRVIQSAPDVLLSYCKEINEEWQELSPWAETLHIFLEQVTAQSILASDLEQIVNSANAKVLADSLPSDLPACPQQPAPLLESAHLPDKLSASSHQRLIHCPYKFFSANILALKAPESITEELKKSEYGSRVHKILESFHTTYKAEISQLKPESKQLQALKDQLTEISKTVFSRDLEDNFLHRGWLKRWLDRTDAYLQWQATRQTEWQFNNAEIDLTANIKNNIKLFGRIDRIDSNNNGSSIIDYKTGASANQDDVDAGEDVQLATYSLLTDNVTRVEYLNLDAVNNTVKTGSCLENDDLHNLQHQVIDRLETMMQMLGDNKGFIANGHQQVCQYCDASGLCRKQVWQTN